MEASNFFGMMRTAGLARPFVFYHFEKSTIFNEMAVIVGYKWITNIIYTCTTTRITYRWSKGEMGSFILVWTQVVNRKQAISMEYRDLKGKTDDELVVKSASAGPYAELLRRNTEALKVNAENSAKQNDIMLMFTFLLFLIGLMQLIVTLQTWQVSVLI